MQKTNGKWSDPCVLGVSPSSRGLGFAVMRKGNVLVDWGVKSVTSGKKNEKCLARFAELLEDYQPIAIAVEDCSKSSRRSERVRELIDELCDLGESEEIKVRPLSRKDVNLRILKNLDGTKHQIAEALSEKYAEQLGFRLPEKRKLWSNQPYQMDIFDAVALAQCYWKSN